MNRLRPPALLAFGLLLSLALGGCRWLGFDARDRDDPCRPVDPGGECFEPNDAEFQAHAEASAAAWPQLNGLTVDAGPVLPVEDHLDGHETWVVPLVSDGSFIATARFTRLPDDTRVKLAEIALLVPPRREFLTPAAGERLTRYGRDGCGNPLEALCVFRDSDLAVLQADGRYRRSDGTVVEFLSN
jgi:hypothetical protein